MPNLRLAEYPCQCLSCLGHRHIESCGSQSHWNLGAGEQIHTRVGAEHTVGERVDRVGFGPRGVEANKVACNILETLAQHSSKQFLALRKNPVNLANAPSTHVLVTDKFL